MRCRRSPPPVRASASSLTAYRRPKNEHNGVFSLQEGVEDKDPLDWQRACARTIRGHSGLEGSMFTENFRSAYRSLRSAPSYTLIAVLSLAMGIGGSVAMFMLVNSIIIRPLAYSEP